MQKPEADKLYKWLAISIDLRLIIFLYQHAPLCFIPSMKKDRPVLPDESAEAGRTKLHGSFDPEEAQENISNSI